MCSQTKFIKAIKFKNKLDSLKEGGEEEMVICDSPGLEDTRGPEIDIANTYGVIFAAHQCKSVIPIVVLSEKGMGDRMNTFKSVSQAIANLFNNVKKEIYRIEFLFTQFLNRTDDNTPIPAEKIQSIQKKLKMNIMAAYDA